MCAALALLLIAPGHAADVAADLAAQTAALRSPADATRQASLKYMRHYAGGIKQAVQALTAALADKNADIRQGAARALGEIGPSARDAAPALVPLLQDRDETVRANAAQALGDISSINEPASAGAEFCALDYLLEDSSAAVRGRAAYALGKFGQNCGAGLQHAFADEHAPRVTALLNDPNAETASDAAMALAAMGRPDPAAARLYVFALGRFEDGHKLADAALRAIGAPAVEALQKVLAEKDREPGCRRDAATMLGRLGEAARPAIPALIEALNDKDIETQNRAAQALVELGAAPLEAAPALVRLAKESAAFRPKSLAAFESMGEHAADYPLALLKLKAKEDTGTRREAARILVRLAPRFKQNPEPLFAGLEDSDDSVRATTLEALAACGAESKTLLAPLTAALADTHPEVAQAACKSLAGMSSEPAALVALAEIRVRGAQNVMRNEAGRAVIAAGTRALPALPVLRQALKDKDDSVREWAMQAIENIGPAAADAIPDMLECLVQFKATRLEAARAMGKFGEKSVDPLIALLSNSDADVRRHAGFALGFVGAPAIAQTAAALSSENADAVEAAIGALERLAPDSAPAIPELVRLLGSKSAPIKSAAQRALAKLGPLAAPALIAEIKKSGIDTSGNTLILTLAQTGRKSVPIIVEALQSEQEAGTVCALVEGLLFIGPGAADGLPAILEVVGRPYGGKDRVKVWSTCASALAAIGAARETAVPVLFEFLSSTEKGTHSDASTALNKIGGEDIRIPSLTDALRNAHPNYVGRALKPFGRAGMTQLVAEMQPQAPDVRDAAAKTFVSLYPDCVPFLIEKLNEENAPAVGILLALGELRAMEIDKRATKINPKALEDMQKVLEPITAELQKRTQSASADEALAALWALGKADPSGPASVVKNFAACAPDLHAFGVAALSYYDLKGQSKLLVPVLPHLLKFTSNTSPLRKQTLAILQSAGYSAESVPALSVALEDPDSSIRATVTVALKSLGPAAVGAVPLAIQILDRGTPQMAASASSVLESIGPDAAPLLLVAMRAENSKLRAAAVNLLTPMKLTAHLKPLAEAARDERDEIAVAALRMIAALKEQGRPAEAELQALLATPNDGIFAECVKTLSKIGANAFTALAPFAADPNEDFALRAMNAMHGNLEGNDTAVLALVKKMLTNENPKLRAAAVLLLPGKETGAPLSFPLLEKAAKDANVLVRVNAAVWLFDNAPFKPDAALPLLLAEIADEMDSVAVVARRTLIQLGEKAKPAAPELRKLLADPRRTTQANAARVLMKLGAAEEPMAVMIFNEVNVRDKIAEYQPNQERFFEEHWSPENAHYYAPTFLETWGTAAKEYAAGADPDGTFNLTGYKLKVLFAQSARAEGGKKEWVVKGFLTGGHALLAWPTQPGVNGRVAYLSGPDGAVYERAITASDLPHVAEWAAAFDPGPEWTKSFVPEKVPKAVPHDYFKPAQQPAERLEF